ncbi:hypothetical protein [Streptomyces atratus]|uniref:hypothetical protein n=1 Tax=Streptomyces atratus TaxID=1893 RepID=UPI0033F82189
MAPSCRSDVRDASPVSLVTPESLEQQLQGDIPVMAHMPQGAGRRPPPRFDFGKEAKEWMKPLVHGHEVDLVEFCGNWYVDDLPPMMFNKHAHNSQGLRAAVGLLSRGEWWRAGVSPGGAFAGVGTGVLGPNG